LRLDLDVLRKRDPAPFRQEHGLRGIGVRFQATALIAQRELGIRHVQGWTVAQRTARAAMLGRDAPAERRADQAIRETPTTSRLGIRPRDRVDPALLIVQDEHAAAFNRSHAEALELFVVDDG